VSLGSGIHSLLVRTVNGDRSSNVRNLNSVTTSSPEIPENTKQQK